MTAPPPPRGGARARWPALLVVGGIAAGVGVVMLNHFRRGTVIIAASVLLMTVLRAVLPERTAGLLAVRSRRADVLTTGILGVLLVVLALAVPRPS